MIRVRSDILKDAVACARVRQHKSLGLSANDARAE